MNDPEAADKQYEIVLDEELVVVALELLDEYDEAFKELAV